VTPTARMVPPWNVPGVLYSLLTASVLPAIAAAAKLITLVYSVRRMTNEDGNNRSAHSCLCLYRTRNGSTELAQNPWNIRKPRCLCGASLSVICWDWTGAFALKRMPEPLAGKSAGSYLGLGRKGLRPQSPHVSYNWNSHFSSAGSTSFPVYPYASAFPVPNANQFRSAKARSTHACVISGLPKAPSPLACSLVHSFLSSLVHLFPCSLVPLFPCSIVPCPTQPVRSGHARYRLRTLATSGTKSRKSNRMSAISEARTRWETQGLFAVTGVGRGGLALVLTGDSLSMVASILTPSGAMPANLVAGIASDK